MGNLIKLAGYIVQGIEWAKKKYADFMLARAQAKAAKGDQRELEKVVGGNDGPTKRHYDGMFERTDPKKPPEG